MDVIVRRGNLATQHAGLLAVAHGEGSAKLAGAARRLDRATRGAVGALLAAGDFRGRTGEGALVYAGRTAAARSLVVGLGPARGRTPQAWLLAAAEAARRARDLGAGTLTFALDARADVATLSALAEGAVLGHHRYAAYRRDVKPPLERVVLLAPGPLARGAAAAVARGTRRGEAVCLARDLANTPGQDLVPAALAERALEVARDAGATATVLDVEAMEREGMGAILGVGRGSANPPCFVVLEWSPPRLRGRAPRVPTVVVIGKGVTFDTGGYSLKPREGMSKMKYDMSGAAAVLGLFASLPALAPRVRLVGLIPSAENLVGSRALKPGDVVRALDGTTIEVTNTDAEGRLLLADALGYAKRFRPDVVLDLATLTGAISVALGHAAAGLFTRDDALAAALAGAGEAVGERLWRMPLWDEYRVEMKGGETADLVNSSERREGGACTAAAFLEHFAGRMRWAHLDIASTAWTFTARADSARGANGFGVRLLVRWLESLAR